MSFFIRHNKLFLVLLFIIKIKSVFFFFFYSFVRFCAFSASTCQLEWYKNTIADTKAVKIPDAKPIQSPSTPHWSTNAKKAPIGSPIT